MKNYREFLFLLNYHIFWHTMKTIWDSIFLFLIIFTHSLYYMSPFFLSFFFPAKKGLWENIINSIKKHNSENVRKISKCIVRTYITAKLICLNHHKGIWYHILVHSDNQIFSFCSLQLLQFLCLSFNFSCLYLAYNVYLWNMINFLVSKLCVIC